MNRIIDTAITHARTVMSVLVFVLLTGAAAYIAIPKESFPDISIPVIYVDIHHEGISPGDSERLLVKPMENELRGIEGVREMTSYAREGGASISLEFDAGFNADEALLDVREKVDDARAELPEDTDEPTIHEVNASLFPIVTVALSGDVPQRTLMQIGRNLRDDIESLPPVLSANLRGEREELLEVLIDPAQVEAYNISANDLIQTVVRNNKLVAAGVMDTGAGRFSVKVPGLFEEIEDVAGIPVKVDGDAIITLSDVAQVRRTFKDATNYARVNGEPAVTIDVVKRTGRNTIETVEGVKMVVESHREFWPGNISVNYVQNQADDVADRLSDLKNSVISAILLVVMVTVATLGLRAAGLVGVSIPTSFLFGIAVLWFMGLTINMVVLFSLVLAVGMLVDGAIVVTELADRKMAEGKDRRDAFALAAKRMAWPITASTVTTLAAFLPLLFWPNVVGEFMSYLPLTLIATLSGSLIAALIFLPTLGSLIGRPSSSDKETLKALAAAEGGDVTRLPGFTGRYARFLSRVIHKPFQVLAIAIGLLVGTWGVYGVAGHGVDFFPRLEPSFAQLQVRARGNLSADEKDSLVREVEAIARDTAGIEDVYGNTTTAEGAGQGGSDAPRDLIGTVTVIFHEWGQRPPADDILASIRARTDDLAGIIVQSQQQQAGPESGKDLHIEISTRYPDLLPLAVAQIRGHLENNVEDLTDIEDSRPLPGIEWEFTVDRSQAGRFGTDTLTVGNAIQLVTNGIKVGEYRPDNSDEEIDIRARYPVSERTLTEIDSLRLQTPSGLVPVSNFIERRPKQRVGAIERVDGRQIMTIRANVEKGVLADTKVKEIETWLDGEADLDPRVQVRFRGQNEDQEESQAFLMNAFIIALFIMAIILVTQFNSFYHAFLILSAVILSTVGVVMGLLITGRSFVVVMTGIGIIALAGIVVNNNIVLIDTYAHLRRQGSAVFDAIVRTGAQRLRPVLLTTVTTVIGLMPMVFQTNIDFVNRSVTTGEPDMAWWMDLSTAIVFGLSFATLLTLIVTPCLLAAPTVLKEKLGIARFGDLFQRRPAGSPAE